ncbi:GNAT family N-acetyltransferase [Streptomyces sp. MspMP-M5]|uniref:GNAT family N-acetyltransferase n=1 Tax=unclassified Streptomyces TaxID=2593676 RepID=UPI0003A9164E|nr:GNAT family N-acetyltransferase [Streptomyces sp. MspMP-M5]MYT29598.1 GNAT family N-acetyltransferase [Streptomyces sp. SID8354]
MVSPERTVVGAPAPWQIDVVDSVSEIPPEVWRKLAPPDDPIYEYALFQAMERAGIGPDAYRYLLLRQGQQIRAVLPTCAYRALALEDALGNEGRRALRPLHRLMGRPLHIRLLLCGHLLGEGRVLRADALDESAPHLLIEAVRRLSASMGTRWTVFKDFPQADLEWLDPALRRAGYFRAPGLPDAHISLHTTTFEEYVSTLSRNNRSTTRRNLARFSEHDDVTMEVRERFDDLVPAMMPLYEAVLDHAESRLDVWTPEFFSLLSTDPRISAKAVTCWEKDRLVGFLVCLFGAKNAVAIRIGIDYDCSRELRLYQVTYYRGIEEAIRLGMADINLTQTAYEAKRKMGCHLVRFEHAVTHSNPVCRTILRHVFPMALNRSGDRGQDGARGQDGSARHGT